MRKCNPPQSPFIKVGIILLPLFIKEGLGEIARIKVIA
jgi:hypothetical protein